MIDILDGTLSMISRLGVKENCELIQIGHEPDKPLHFSSGVTTAKDLAWSISLGLSSSLMLMNVSLFMSYWLVFSLLSVPFIKVMSCIRTSKVSG